MEDKKMKKHISLLFAFIITLSALALPTSATSTTKYFTADLNSSYSDTWFADVLLSGEIVGYGNTFYKKPWLWGDKKVSTEYQNYNLGRSLGQDMGIDIKVYSYIKVGSSIVDSTTYAWSSDGWQGGNSLGWIQADASTSRNSNVSAVGGYVRITNTNTYSSDTYNYQITNNS